MLQNIYIYIYIYIYITTLILKRPKSTYLPILKKPKSRYPPILKSIFMKIEIFVFFKSVNQNLSFHVHNVKFLSQERLKKLSGTLSLNDI